MLEPRPDPMIARDLVDTANILPIRPGREAPPLRSISILTWKAAASERWPMVTKFRNRCSTTSAPVRMKECGFHWWNWIFEYGSRRGIWRLLDLFQEFSIHVSILAVARAIEQNLPMAKAFVGTGATKLSVTGIAGSIIAWCPRRLSAIMSGAPSRSLPG